MNYAGRFNSFIFKGQTVFDAIEAYKKMDGITHLEFNYPEHIAGYDLNALKAAIVPLKVNGFAVRWRREWLDGDFTNPDSDLRRKAIQLTKDACDTCRELGGSVITLWFENTDGALGVNEWAMRTVSDPATFGVFSSNISDPALELIEMSARNESVLRAIVNFGSNDLVGDTYRLARKVLAGEPYEKDNFDPLSKITTENVADFR